MSPWANVAAAAEVLGKRAVFSYKPHPTFLASDPFDLTPAREQLRDALEKTRDCIVEVTLKDIFNVRGEPERMGAWVDMARQLAEEYA